MSNNISNGNSIDVLGYEITTETSFLDEVHGISLGLSSQMEGLYKEANDKKNSAIIQKLTDLIVEFPNAPVLKNYLSIAYNLRGNTAKAIETNNWMLAEHPDYLHGKINQAQQHLDNNDFEKVEDLLGKEMELKSLYPDRNLFHVEEATFFLNFAIRYFIKKDDLEAAEIRLQMLEALDPDYPELEAMYNAMMFAGIEKVSGQLAMEHNKAIAVVTDKHPPKTNETEQPIFNHPIITELYKYNHEINQSILKEILALPRETLVADLEAVLKDTVNRHYYFVDEAGGDKNLYFHIHALLLLAELKSDSSLPVILEVLSYDSAFIEFWFGDFITEALWLVYYKLAENNLGAFKNFLLAPGIDTYVKGEVSSALLQLYLHNQLAKEEMVLFYQTIYEGFLDAGINSNIVDADVLGFLVCESIYANFVELLPIIKQLFDKGYISEGVCGSYAEVARDIRTKPNYNKKERILTIFEYYDELIVSWAEHEEYINPQTQTHSMPSNDKSANAALQLNTKVAPVVLDKVGRNEPCPCGSGKKYKKCCLE